MKWGCMVIIVLSLAFLPTMTRADEPVALRECRAAMDRLKKDIADIEKKLTPLEEETKKQEEKITKYQRFKDKYGAPVDTVQKEIQDLEKKLAQEIRKGGSLAGTGRNPSMDKFISLLDQGGKQIRALQAEIKEKMAQKQNRIREAEKALEKEFPSDTFLSLDDFYAELTALVERQRRDEAVKQSWSRRLASKKADLSRKRKECELLAKNTSGSDNGQPLSGNGVVTFIGELQIPTPRSGMDLPIEYESGPNFEDAWGYIPLMQISYNDPRTKAYYTALKEDFTAAFGTKEGDKVLPDSSLFSKSGAEYAALLENSRNAGWKKTPIMPYYGTYLVFVECDKRIQFRLHIVRPDARSTYGGAHIFGLKPGRHPARMVIGTADGQRFDANFALVVKHEPEKRTFTNFEMGPDGKMIDTGKSIVVDLIYLKKTFIEMWGNHMKSREDAQKKGDKALLRATLEMGMQLVYSTVENMKNQPGCTNDNVDPLLTKGRDAVILLLTQFGTDINDHVPWEQMLNFAKLCKGVGSRTAYDVLNAVVLYASNYASKIRLDTLGYAYELLGEIALIQGRFKEALAHLNTGLEYHKQFNPNYLTEKGRTELPNFDQLEGMLKTMSS